MSFKFREVKFFLFIALQLGFSSDFLPCDVAAPIALLMNAENGKVLFSKNGNEPCSPASTTKMATALYALSTDRISLDDQLTASSEAVGSVPSNLRRSKHPSYRLEHGGTHIGLKVGETMSFQDLLYGLMLPSGNDAANVIAEAVSGSISQFIVELNLYLQSIGCKNTHFCNPHGLPDKNHTTTAFDLAMIAKESVKDPVLRKIVAARKFFRPATNKQPEAVLPQNNSLIKPGTKFYYPHATGIKTGYVAEGYALVASAEKNGRSLIAVVCHCDEMAKRYRSVIQMFETAFAESKKSRKLFSAREDRFSQEIEGAKNRLEAILEEDVAIEYYPSEGVDPQFQVEWNQMTLPVLKGSKVGDLSVYDGTKFISKISLISDVDVTPTFSYHLRERMLSKLRRHHIGYLIGGIMIIYALLYTRRGSFNKARKG